MRAFTHLNLSSNAAVEGRRFEQVLAREFYSGSMVLEVSNGFVIKCDQGLGQPIRVVSQSLENVKLSYRRTWEDIRRDRCDVYVIWFVRHGWLALTQAGRSCVAQAGDCMVITAGAPFRSEAWAGDSGRHESIAVIVPKHLVLSSCGGKMQLATPVSTRHGDAAAASSACQLLLEHGGEMSAVVAEALATSCIKAIFRATASESSATSSQSDGRWSDIEACIASQFSNAETSIETIALRCRLSVRWVCALAKAHGTTIAELLWKKRLEKSREWLQCCAMRKRTISEIARLAGFKSVAHFSRRFRDAYGTSPSEFRRLSEPARLIEVADNSAARETTRDSASLVA